MAPLTPDDRAVLDLESQWFATAGGKETAVRALGWTPVRYYRRLNQLLDSELALAYEPVVVRRLQRIRDGRRF